MLFTSQEYILYFLPIVFLLYCLSGYLKEHRKSLVILVISSLFFYAWWDYRFLLLLISSILANYTFGKILAHNPRKSILGVAVCLNLLAIGYFKYVNFFIESINTTLGYHIEIPEIVLPLAISFFTFQQIAYLVDCYTLKKFENSLVDYSLFVSFFPQLIAGPIVHHSEMLPQFKLKQTRDKRLNDVTAGVVLIGMGLFKKLLLADQIAIFSDTVFAASSSGIMLSYTEAWCGALAYTFQIYFDFSGYTDMAMGSARLFGIRLPMNFNSPYKAKNPSEFWARWHITLSRFLRDYLYIPLGGSKKGRLQTLTNLIVTMLLGGLWHGANWTFVIWGGIHGIYLAIFHMLRGFYTYKLTRFSKHSGMIFISDLFSRSFTFLTVVVAWVFFRADSVASAQSFLGSMFFVNGFYLPDFMFGTESLNNTAPLFLNGIIGDPFACISWIFILTVICFYLPNSMDIVSYYEHVNKEPEQRTTHTIVDRQFGKELHHQWMWWKGYILLPSLGVLVVFFAMIFYMAPDTSPFIYTIF